MKTIHKTHLSFFQYNGPFEDPHLLIKDKRSGENILFDCGDLSKIPIHELMKVKYLFLSHYHMDHFIGFVQLIRVLLSAPSSRVLHIYGPEGLCEHISHIIKGFTWNLLTDNSFSLCLTEVRETEIWNYPPFIFYKIPSNPTINKIPITPSSVLLTKDSFSIEFCPLNHKIRVLGFRISENPKLHFMKESCPYPIGVWIKEVKQKYFQTDEKILITLSLSLSKTLGELKHYFTLTPKTHFVYVTDFSYDAKDTSFLSFCHDAEILFIESHFLGKDENLAKKTHHLSTQDVRDIVDKTKPKKIILFHFSRRYLSFCKESLFYKEALEKNEEIL